MKFLLSFFSVVVVVVFSRNLFLMAVLVVMRHGII